jgi:hypothetical protein
MVCICVCEINQYSIHAIYLIHRTSTTHATGTGTGTATASNDTMQNDAIRLDCSMS